MATSSRRQGEQRAIPAFVGSFISIVMLVGGCRQQNYFDELRDSSTDLPTTIPVDVRASEAPLPDAARSETPPPDATRPEAPPSDALTDLSPPVKQIRSPCLDAMKVIPIADVTDGNTKTIEVKRDDNHATYDMRGVTVLAKPTTHLVDFVDPASLCVTGVSAVAKYPSGFVINWENVKYGSGTFGPYDEGGLHTSYPRSGKTIFDRVYVEAIEDGLMLARVGEGDSTQTWELSHSYLKNVIDDAVENDGFRSGKISNVFSEGTHMFYSERNDQVFAHNIIIEESVIDFGCKPDDRPSVDLVGACPAGTSTQTLLKLREPKLNDPKITINISVRDTIIHHPAISREGRFHTCLPLNKAYENDNVKYEFTYQNVRIVWTNAAAYPCRELPPGVSVTTDPTVYKNARETWLLKHGCKLDGTACEFLRKL